MAIRKQIWEAQIIPKGYGIAYWEMESMLATCYPVPLNLLVGLARHVYRWLRDPWSKTDDWKVGRESLRSAIEHAQIRGYRQGFDDGWDYACQWLEFKVADFRRKVNHGRT